MCETREMKSLKIEKPLPGGYHEIDYKEQIGGAKT